MRAVTEDDVERRLLDYRKREEGRGRAANRPVRIPPRGWRDIAIRTVEQIGKDRANLAAAGVAFLGLLALFPAIAAFVSLYGVVADVTTARQHIDALAGVVPASALELIGAELERVASVEDAGAGIGVFVGLAITLWMANNGMRTLFVAMNVAYDEQETRDFFRLTATTLAMTAGALLTVIVAVNVIVLVPAVLAAMPLGPVGGWMARLVPYLVLFVLLNVFVALLHRFGPSRRSARWSWVSAGSIATTLALVAASVAFSIYLANFGNYNATYGTLGAVVSFMMWLYLSAFVLIAGAELNAEIERQTVHDTTVGPARPMGARGARVADTLGESR